MTAQATEQPEARGIEYWIAHTSDNPTAALIQSLNDRVLALEAQLAEETEATDNWRRLALQFDGHRMQALGFLKALLKGEKELETGARMFVASPPIPGEQVLAERIAAMAPAFNEALQLLAGLHPGLTIDGPPMAVAECIFDAVIAEQRALKSEIAKKESNLDLMRKELAKRGNRQQTQPSAQERKSLTDAQIRELADPFIYSFNSDLQVIEDDGSIEKFARVIERATGEASAPVAPQGGSCLSPAQAAARAEVQGRLARGECTNCGAPAKFQAVRFGQAFCQNCGAGSAGPAPGHNVMWTGENQ